MIARYDPKEHRVYSATIQNEPGNMTKASFITPVYGECDLFVVGMGLHLGVVEWDGESPTARYDHSILVVDEDPTNSFNDGKVDTRGRVWSGTLRERICDDPDVPPFGNLYRVDTNGDAATIFPPDFVKVSNGLCWNETEFFYVDSCAMDVKVFDYDPETGEICMSHCLIAKKFSISTF